MDSLNGSSRGPRRPEGRAQEEVLPRLRGHYGRGLQPHSAACAAGVRDGLKLLFVYFVQVCEAVAGYRDTVGLTKYFNECKALGLGSKASYTLYLTGRAPDSSAVSMRDYRERGTTLEALRREWLSTWYQS